MYIFDTEDLATLVAWLVQLYSVRAVASQQCPGFETWLGRCLSVWSWHVLPVMRVGFSSDTPPTIQRDLTQSL